MLRKVLLLSLIIIVLMGCCACKAPKEDVISHNVKPETHIHSFSEATCTSPELCSCGQTNGEPLGHVYAPATCTAPQICKRCNTSTGSPLGHDYSAATCSTPQICNRCNASTGNALEHDFVPASCIAPKTCSRCGASEGTELGHDYSENQCTRCGYIDPNSIPVRLETLPLLENGYSYRYNSGSMTDTYGNTYVGYHYFNPSGDGARDSYAIYYLDGKYSTLSLDIVAHSNHDNGGNCSVRIYVDDVLQFSQSDITRVTKKIHTDINVKSADKIEIQVIRANSYINRIAIVNAELTK